MASESPRHTYLLAILTAVLAFLGAAGGTYFGHRLEQQRQRYDLDYQWREHILQRRLELVERTTGIINKTYGAAVLAAAIQQRLPKQQANAAGAQPPSASDELVKYQLQLGELHAEFGSVLSLDNLFFGDKTRTATKAILDHGPAWWTMSPALQEQLLKALNEEMTEPPLQHMKRKGPTLTAK